MNAKQFLYVLMTFAGLTSCNMETENSSSPDIIMVNLPISLKNDTFKIKSTDNQGVYLMDTMTVGDTLNFNLILQAYYNNLKTFGLTQYSDSSTRIILTSKASLDSIFSSSSNYSRGLFYMGGNYNNLFFKFMYVARKASNEAKLTFSVASDAKIDQYQSTFEIRTPIKSNE